MSPTATLLALGLLLKGCLRREILATPMRALSQHLVLPTAVVCVVSFIDTGATAHGGWPKLAMAGAVWLLFANSVNYGGMTLWHERRLLRRPGIPAGLLLAAAALLPIALFGVHLITIKLALLTSSFPRGGTPVATAVAGGIATAAGLGTGILAARVCGVRPNFVFVLPTLLLASLVLTPVFYRPATLDRLEGAWFLANPLSVATELARAGISLETEPLPRHAILIACTSSGAILCWGLLTLRLTPASAADEHV